MIVARAILELFDSATRLPFQERESISLHIRILHFSPRNRHKKHSVGICKQVAILCTTLDTTYNMSLFNRPAWATTDVSDDDEPDENLFSHSNQYNEIVADEQRKKRERAEKQRLKQERRERRSSAKRIKDEREPVRNESPKRRRITLEEGEELLGSVGLSPAVAKRQVRGADSSDEDHDIVRRRSPRFNKVVNRDGLRSDLSSSTLPAAIIELGESDTELSLPHTVPPAVPVEEESDEEFAELARIARARKAKADAAEKVLTPDLRSPTPRQDTANTSRDVYPTPPPLPDPTVKLFISSELPDTKPLIVYRKLSQRLQEIRKVWCKQQGFTEEHANDIFLTHRMKKLYDVTTCKSLGLYVSEQGQLAMKGAEGLAGVDQVHLEAVTEELFARLKARKDYEERKRQGLLSSEEEAKAATPETQAPPTDEPLIHLKLRAKGHHGEYRLRVKPVRKMPLIV